MLRSAKEPETGPPNILLDNQKAKILENSSEPGLLTIPNPLTVDHTQSGNLVRDGIIQNQSDPSFEKPIGGRSKEANWIWNSSDCIQARKESLSVQYCFTLAI